MSETIESHEHAQHAAEHGKRGSALLIAVLAAGLAFTEQGAQHAQTSMSAHAIAAADLWAQYQAKSIRANEARDLASLAQETVPAGPGRDSLVAKLQGDSTRFENDPKTGKAAIAASAKAEEGGRDRSHEKLEAFDNAAAALQLGIVLVTASVIAESTPLVMLGAGLGLVGMALGVLGGFRPEWANF